MALPVQETLIAYIWRHVDMDQGSHDGAHLTHICSKREPYSPLLSIHVGSVNQDMPSIQQGSTCAPLNTLA